MKFRQLWIIVFLFFTALQHSSSQQRNFGLGIMIGEPTGISGKVWTSPDNAVDFGIGWSMEGDRMINTYYRGTSRLHIHMDYLWHTPLSVNSTDRFPLYYGIGGRINSGSNRDASLAVRGVLGLAWMPQATPIDVFLELVPMIQLTSYVSSGLEAAIGIRYYF